MMNIQIHISKWRKNCTNNTC